MKLRLLVCSIAVAALTAGVAAFTLDHKGVAAKEQKPTTSQDCERVTWHWVQKLYSTYPVDDLGDKSRRMLEAYYGGQSVQTAGIGLMAGRYRRSIPYYNKAVLDRTMVEVAIPGMCIKAEYRDAPGGWY